jgi:hypothetical protein
MFAEIDGKAFACVEVFVYSHEKAENARRLANVKEHSQDW